MIKKNVITYCVFLTFAICHSNSILARHDESRNKSNNAYRNHYQRVWAWGNNTSEIRGGRIYNCGDNTAGSLGIGNIIDQYFLVQMGVDSDWVSIVGGNYDGAPKALKSNGTLWGWGINEHGEIGNGNTTDQYTPVQIGNDNDWLHVASGTYHALAVKSNGTMWVWGQNDVGQLGLGNTTEQHSPVQMGNDNDWVAVTVGDNCSFAIKSNGTLWAWGGNFEGELGQGDTNRRFVPTQVGNDDRWVIVTSMAKTVMGLKSDGTLWSWGNNTFGQLGIGNTNTQYSPVQVGTDNDWVMVSGRNTVMALKSNGSLWGWGENTFGSLGLGYTGGSHYIPEPLAITGCADVSSMYNAIVIKTDGSMWVCGRNNFGQQAVGYANIFQSIDTFHQVSTPAKEEWISGATGGGHTLALKSNGSIWAWGHNDHGQLGLGNTTDADSMMRIGADSNWVALSAGSNHSLALKQNGSLWAWGANTEGQLGTGNNAEQHSPVQVAGTWVAMASGDVHNLALKADGTLWAWGNNNLGQLGLGDYSNRNSPVQVGTEHSWIAIAAGEGHSLALKADGTLWAWGLNIYGQLGIGNNTIQNIPVQVGNEHNWTMISAGANHSLAMKADGTLWVWGRNGDGQLGNGSYSNSNVPLQVAGNTWLDIRACANYSMGWKTDGTLWTWGNNDHGQLGLGNNIGYNSPQAAPESGLVHVFTGPEAMHSAIIKDTRRLLCLAGNNDHGQLGDGSTTDMNTFECINECVQPLITITASPGDTVCSADTTTFTATISNAGPGPQYQWFVNNVPVGFNSPSYTAINSLNDGDVVSCVLTGNAACMINPTDTSNTITMHVTTTLSPYVSITVAPDDTVCNEFNNVTFTATAGNAGPSPSYQWLVNGQPAGSNSNSFSTTVANGDDVLCVVTSSSACASPLTDTSNTIHMTVVPVTLPQVTITANPGTVIAQNQGVTFTAMATNAGPSPQYQWRKNGSDLAGQTQQTYTTTTLQTGDVIACRVRGLNRCDTATSNELLMAVWPLNVPQVTTNSEQLTVYPNPVTDILNISYDKDLQGEMQVLDVAGRVLIRQTLSHSLDMKALASGVYMLHVLDKTTGHDSVHMLVKE